MRALSNPRTAHSTDTQIQGARNPFFLFAPGLRVDPPPMVDLEGGAPTPASFTKRLALAAGAVALGVVVVSVLAATGSFGTSGDGQAAGSTPGAPLSSLSLCIAELCFRACG